MIRAFICCFILCLPCFSEGIDTVNQFNISELLKNLASVEKVIYILPNNDSIILYMEGNRVLGISRMSDNKNREFHTLLPSKIVLDEVPHKSHYDYYKVRKLEQRDRLTLTKLVAGIYQVQYVFDQNSRIIKFFSDDQEIIFLHRTGYTRVNYQRGVKHSELIMRTKAILGTLDNFVIKDLDGDIILVVMDDIPYIPVLDKEGSLVKILDETGKDVASIVFSKAGNIVQSTGELNAPYCFRGMYREKISEIYFDEKGYYDADLGDRLVFKKPSSAEYDQEVEF